VLCQQLPGFVDADRPDVVCLLDKSLYGLRQAQRAWFTRFAEFVIKLGFRATRSDSSLFILCRGGNIAYLLLYVDDIVLTGLSSVLLRMIVDRLRAEFAVRDMGALSFFLGIDVRRTNNGFYLTQHRCAEDILERAGTMNCKPVATHRSTPKASFPPMHQLWMMHTHTAAWRAPSNA
jgi:histone deacetylase 1/2